MQRHALFILSLPWWDIVLPTRSGWQALSEPHNSSIPTPHSRKHYILIYLLNTQYNHSTDAFHTIKHSTIHLRLLVKELKLVSTYIKLSVLWVWCQLPRCSLGNKIIYIWTIFLSNWLTWTIIARYTNCFSVMNKKVCVMLLYLMFVACCILPRTDAVINPQYNCRPSRRRSSLSVM